MIKKWLLKHRWVIEEIKSLVAGFCFVAAYSIYMAPPNSSHERVLGVAAGVIGMAGVSLLVDVLYSIPEVIKARRKNAQE